MKRIIALLLAVVLLFSCVDGLTVSAVGTDTDLLTTDAEWQTLQEKLDQYEAVWTDGNLTGAVSNMMVQTALMGNGDVGANSDGTSAEKTYRISKQDFWDYDNTNPLSVGGVTIRSAEVPFSNMTITGCGHVTSGAGYPLDRIIDGKMQSDGDTWACNTNHGTAGEHHFTIDFGKVYALKKYVIYHQGAYNSKSSAMNTVAFTVSVSADGTNYETVQTVTENTANTTEFEFDAAKNVRYVKVEITDPSSKSNDNCARIAEMAFYEEAEAEMSVSGCGELSDYPLANIIDGSETSYGSGWACSTNHGTNGHHHFTIDLGNVYTLKSYELCHQGTVGAENYNTKAFAVSVSSDGINYETVQTVTENTASKTTFTFENETDVRYVKVEITVPTQDGTYTGRMGEMRFYDAEGNNIKSLSSGDFKETLSIVDGTLNTDMVIEDVPVSFCNWVSATDNVMITQVTSKGATDVALESELFVRTDYAKYPLDAGTNEDGTIWVSKTSANSKENTAGYEDSWKSKVVLMSKVLGAESTAVTNEDGSSASFKFTLPAEGTVYILTAVGGGGQNYDWQGTLQGTEPAAEASNILAQYTDAASISTLKTANDSWWKDYWLKSYIDIGDEQIHRYYYGSLYYMACTAREDTLPSGLYGIWITTDKARWSGDYHLNYNMISPFYGMYSSNRAEFAKSLKDPLLDYMENGEQRALSDLAKESGASNNMMVPEYINGGTIRDTITSKTSAEYSITSFAGRTDLANGISDAILYPVGLGPWGLTTDSNYWMQVYNAGFSGMAVTAYYNYTKDAEYFAEVYPFLLANANFYEAWCEKEVFEDGTYRYNIWSGAHEGTFELNAGTAVGTVKNILECLIDAVEDGVLKIGSSEGCYVTQEKYNKWVDMYENFADYPVADGYYGQGVSYSEPVVLLSEQGVKLWKGSANVDLEFVAPAQQVGFDTDPELVEAARNAIELKETANSGIWKQKNNTPKIYLQAIRVGVSAEYVMNKFKSLLDAQMLENYTINDATHGIEKAGAIEFINTMLLQSDDGIIKVFPNWTGADASFTRLRERGAFVVSSSMQDGKVTQIEVTSEAGGNATFVNPWGNIKVLDASGNTVSFTRGTTKNTNEETITFNTTKGASYTLVEDTNSDATGNIISVTEESVVNGQKINLTDLGTVDWMITNGKAINANDLSYYRKTVSDSAISPLTYKNNASTSNFGVNETGHYISASWTDGTPDASKSDVKTATGFRGVGNYLLFTVDAQEFEQTLTLSLGVNRSASTLSAWFESDSGAVTTVATIDNTNTADKVSGLTGAHYTNKAGKIITIKFSSPHEGDKLVLQYTMTTDNAPGNGQALFNFAALSGTPELKIAEVENGKISVTNEEPVNGDTVVVTATPDAGYMLVTDSLKQNETVVSKTDGNYSFVMPYANVTLTAEFISVAELQTMVENAKTKLATLTEESTEYTALSSAITSAENLLSGDSTTAEAIASVMEAINNAMPISVTGISLDKSEVLLVVGNTKTITATVTPENASNKDVSWSSSDERVATVENGVVTAVGKGTVTITATTTDGGKTASCVVRVLDENATLPTITSSTAGLTWNQTVNLTELGTVDWMITNGKQINSNSLSYYRKDMDDPAISGLTYSNNDNNSNFGVEEYSHYISASWTDGTPDASKSAVKTATGFRGAGNYMQFTVDAQEYEQTLVLSLGVNRSISTLTAWFESDPDTVQTITTINNTETGDKISGASGAHNTNKAGKMITINFSSPIENDKLVLRYTMNTDNAPNNGQALFNFAALSVTPVTVTGVTLDKTAISLAVDGTETIAATVVPNNASNKDVSWSSSDESVATVADGVVTAVGKGTATITVTTADGGKTATCAVTVTLDTSAIDEAISTANGAKANVEVSDSADKVTAGKQFVTEAEMTALTDAIAAANTAKENAKTSADVTNAVNVLNAAVTAFTNAKKTGTYVAATGISLNKAVLNLSVGDTETLVATITPENATNKSVTWETSDDKVVTVDQEGKVTAVGKGVAIITVTITDANGNKTTLSAVCTVDVTLDVSVLQAAIDDATSAMNSVSVIDGKVESEVAKDTKFVTTAEMKALTDAIATAKEAKESVKTEADVTSAVNALNTAVDIFKQAIKTGTYVAPQDVSAIDTALSAADAAKTGVEVIDKSADQVNKDTKFVTTAEMKALTDAISAAEATKASAKTEADITSAVEALNAAVEAFKQAIKTGTYVELVTITIDVTATVENKTQPGISPADFKILIHEGDAQLVATETDDAGKAKFQLSFNAENIGKTVTYTISQKKGHTTGVKYDQTVHTIKVTVEQKADGSLYTIINEKETDTVSVSFKNVYEKSNTPVTGDNSQIILFGGLMFISIAAIAVILLIGKQKKEKYTGKYMR